MAPPDGALRASCTPPMPWMRSSAPSRTSGRPRSRHPPPPSRSRRPFRPFSINRASTLARQLVWDIGHYFWFLRELLAAGYPADYRSLPEDERITAYVRAYHATRNTSMHWVVDHLFRACPLELVLGSSVDNLDAVQAATIFPNVHVGGMWWYNFRASTYRASMQYRLEGLPPSKSVLVVSDARAIEWCYGKVVLIKRLLAEFLSDQIERGWIGRDDALWVAREWLYGAAAVRYDGHRAGAAS